MSTDRNADSGWQSTSGHDAAVASLGTAETATGRSFGHESSIWAQFPHLQALVVTAELAVHPTTELTSDLTVAPLTGRPGESDQKDPLQEWIAAQMSHAPVMGGSTLESSLPSVAAWRAAFSRLGLRPTQYRCAAESLLRRLRTRGDLPRIHPLVDICNAVSVRFAVPVAALDLDAVTGALWVGPATGNEVYTDFDGSVQHPQPGEVVYRDSAGLAHSRRWCWRQSAVSAVSASTCRVLIVAEALHDGAGAELTQLQDELLDGLSLLGRAGRPAILTASTPTIRLDEIVGQ
ncbi:phenylalanine--tRNA ligase beta subunit-related protein [Asanoa sp. NPDC049573]|uniref:B3/B4 domain-containing protein n=1 Tax=Asanoa sp. NPDC049573 TaxID=3155396 RepID=UPI003416ED33